MKLAISTSGFPYDVDHMPGRRIVNRDTIHTDYKLWKRHAEHINSQKYGDQLAVISDSQSEKYEDDEGTGKRVAFWDKLRKIGTVYG